VTCFRRGKSAILVAFFGVAILFAIRFGYPKSLAYLCRPQKCTCFACEKQPIGCTERERFPVGARTFSGHKDDLAGLFMFYGPTLSSSTSNK
jgi:hypothetical protein